METTQELSLSLGPPQRPDEIGRLGAYRVLKAVGRGGMGVVYQAEDITLKRLVALKVMLPRLAADPTSRQRFLREARAMAAVHHDHIAAIYQVGEEKGIPYIAMEFFQGTPLDKWLKQGHKPTVAQVLRIGREIAEALAAAHALGLIHRDIKPGNIWLDSSHGERVKILDFGLVCAPRKTFASHMPGPSSVRRLTWRRNRPAPKKWTRGVTCSASVVFYTGSALATCRSAAIQRCHC